MPDLQPVVCRIGGMCREVRHVCGVARHRGGAGEAIDAADDFEAEVPRRVDGDAGGGGPSGDADEVGADDGEADGCNAELQEAAGGGSLQDPEVYKRCAFSRGSL